MADPPLADLLLRRQTCGPAFVFSKTGGLQLAGAGSWSPLVLLLSLGWAAGREGVVPSVSPVFLPPAHRRRCRAPHRRNPTPPCPRPLRRRQIVMVLINKKKVRKKPNQKKPKNQKRCWGKLSLPCCDQLLDWTACLSRVGDGGGEPSVPHTSGKVCPGSRSALAAVPPAVSWGTGLPPRSSLHAGGVSGRWRRWLHRTTRLALSQPACLASPAGEGRRRRAALAAPAPARTTHDRGHTTAEEERCIRLPS